MFCQRVRETGCRRFTVAVLVCHMSSCSPGPELIDIGGVITFDGAAAGPGFVVSFLPEAGGRPSQSFTDEFGRYRMLFTDKRSGVLKGRHRVIITWPYPADKGPDNPHAAKLPAAVGSPADTWLTVVAEEAREYDIEVIKIAEKP